MKVQLFVAALIAGNFLLLVEERRDQQGRGSGGQTLYIELERAKRRSLVGCFFFFERKRICQDGLEEQGGPWIKYTVPCNISFWYMEDMT